MSPRRARRPTHAVPADDSYHHIIQIGQELHRWLDHTGQELGAEARLVKRFVLAVELLDGRLAAPEGLHESVAGVHLFHVAVQRPGSLPLRRELHLRAAGHKERHDEREGNGHERDSGEQWADPEHDRDDTEDRERRAEQLAQSLLEGRGDVVDVVGDAAQDVPVRVPVEVRERKPRELRLHVLAHAVNGPLPRPQP